MAGVKLSTHFYREEFACSCNSCGRDTVDVELIELLEDILTHFNRAVTVTSGHRCKAFNAEIGGAKDSQHLYGRAADIIVSEVSPVVVVAFINGLYPDKYGIGTYSKWVHVDTRNTKARWNG